MLVDFFVKGGFFMWPLFGTGVLAIGLIIRKGGQLYLPRIYRAKKSVIDSVRDKIAEKSFDEARELLSEQAPSDRVLRAGIEYLESGFDEDAIKDRLEMVYEEEMHALEKGLAVILILGEIMPMLGLLGTVSGMIQVFKAISVYGASDPSALASGISEALLTTEVGLVLGIPILFCYTLLNSQVDVLSNLMRHSGSTIVTTRRQHSQADV